MIVKYSEAKIDGIYSDKAEAEKDIEKEVDIAIEKEEKDIEKEEEEDK
jgi:hypothetical protein